tara:strand:+ start:695 stop:2299 length:1605 start_codon:yes stop_codon:yes gene_type:complete
LDLIENKPYLYRNIIRVVLFFTFFSIYSQSNEKRIEIISAGYFDRDESMYPDGNILSKNSNKRVQLRHDDMDVFSQKSIFFQNQNSFIATGNVHVIQGDSINLYCDSLNYDGVSKKFSSYGSVKFTNEKMELNSDVLFFDRNKNYVYYNNYGEIIDSLSKIYSKKGTYIIDKKKYEFEENVIVDNPNYKITSNKMDYFINSELAYFFRESRIETESYSIFCNNGFYDTKEKNGIFKVDAIVETDDRKIYGDSIYFDDKLQYASASRNIKIFDKKEDLIVMGEYAEVFQKLDSAIITKNPIAINISKNDSLFIRADTLLSIGNNNHRKVIGNSNVKFLKGNMSGKSDRIKIDKAKGITTLSRKYLSKRYKQILTESEINKINPVIWDGNSQISGDEIILKEDLKNNIIDSLKISNNSFIVEKDTIGKKNNFNQIKGIKLDGKIIDNKLDKIKIDKNAELIYFMYNDENVLIGIDKAMSSSILMYFNEGKIDEILFQNQPEGVLYQEEKLDENQKKLLGFVDRFNERITKTKNFIN